MKTGKSQDAARGFAQLVVIFLTVRVLEAALVVTGFAVAGVIIHESGVGGGPWTLTDLLSTGISVIWYYYVAFGYLIASAVAFVICWAAGLLTSSFKVTVVNFLAFLVHSTVVIVALSGHLPPAIWVCWGLALIYNALFPLRLKAIATIPR